MTLEPKSEHRHRQQHRQGSKFKRWLHRVRTSRREKRRLLQLLFIAAAVLLAFAIGYFYFGPSFSTSE
jgi:hypothetical protein